MMILEPTFKTQSNKEVCTNAKQILVSIKQSYSNETYETIAKRAGVHTQTIQRWSAVGRADADAIRTLINSFTNESNIDEVLLKNATPKQLKEQCIKLGWDKIINA